ncbi:hypothetical protein CCMA1212_003510 [Trichoderma ghanense]|uniref:Uncharacterized protein n=1 Tax=Trichoderma ghanense TaxID=65468 RepID=A0ABY2H9T7_9HYPO
MEKNTEAAQPPPYERLIGAPKNAEEDAVSYDTLSMPQRIMNKILAMRSHAERVRLIKEYTVKKGQIIQTREAALTQQDRVLADAIKRVKSDIKEVQGTIQGALWDIGTRRKHLIRGYLAANFKYGDMKSETAAFPELIAAGEEEARRAYRKEVHRAEAEFRDAAKQLDEKFMAFVEKKLAEMEGSQGSK